MKKERIILACIAIFAGLIVASSLVYFYQQKGESTKTPQEATPAATISNEKPLLDIQSPENESVTDKKTAEVKGKSEAKALIVITTNTDDFTIVASEDGTFSQTVNLTSYENLITVTAYTDNGQSETKNLAITYNTEDF